MFTNERILVIIIFLLIFGAGTYFTVNKFRQETGLSSSPSPSPTLDLKFVLTQTPSPTPQSQPTQPFDNAQGRQPQPQANTQAGPPQPQPSELPFVRNKYVGKFPGLLPEEVLKNKAATLVTSKGNIIIEIYPDSPKAASNFLLLASNGFYDNLIFHRVENGLLIQGGDPRGDGTGGAGYTFEDEPVTRDYVRGTVAYANAGPNTNSSQFFMVIADNPNIPKQYTIFGMVIFGMDVVERIEPKDIIYKVVVQPLR